MRAASSPIAPFARLTMKIFFSSMIWRGWILFTGWPKMLRIVGDRNSRPTLLMTEVVASLCSASCFLFRREGDVDAVAVEFADLLFQIFQNLAERFLFRRDKFRHEQAREDAVFLRHM